MPWPSCCHLQEVGSQSLFLKTPMCHKAQVKLLSVSSYGICRSRAFRETGLEYRQLLWPLHRASPHEDRTSSLSFPEDLLKGWRLPRPLQIIQRNSGAYRRASPPCSDFLLPAALTDNGLTAPELINWDKMCACQVWCLSSTGRTNLTFHWDVALGHTVRWIPVTSHQGGQGWKTVCQQSVCLKNKHL